MCACVYVCMYVYVYVCVCCVSLTVWCIGVDFYCKKNSPSPNRTAPRCCGLVASPKPDVLLFVLIALFLSVCVTYGPLNCATASIHYIHSLRLCMKLYEIYISADNLTTFASFACALYTRNMDGHTLHISVPIFFILYICVTLVCGHHLSPCSDVRAERYARLQMLVALPTFGPYALRA